MYQYLLWAQNADQLNGILAMVEMKSIFLKNASYPLCYWETLLDPDMLLSARSAWLHGTREGVDHICTCMHQALAVSYMLC